MAPHRVCQCTLCEPEGQTIEGRSLESERERRRPGGEMVLTGRCVCISENELRVSFLLPDTRKLEELIASHVHTISAPPHTHTRTPRQIKPHEKWGKKPQYI